MELSHLEKLSGIPGVTGDTSALIRSLAGMAEGYARWEVDPLGSLIVHKKGAARRERPLLLWTPVDEPGLMVTGAEPDGSLKFILSGSLDRRTIPGRRVAVGERQLTGIVGGKAVHHAGKAERENRSIPGSCGWTSARRTRKRRKRWCRRGIPLPLPPVLSGWAKAG